MKTVLITGITGQDGGYLAGVSQKKDMAYMELSAEVLWTSMSV